MLLLLDFSSAFDTIHLSILVHRLHSDNGRSDTVHQWSSSHLTERTHYVSLSHYCCAIDLPDLLPLLIVTFLYLTLLFATQTKKLKM